MKKILFVIDSLENNGAVRSLISLLNALEGEKYEIDLFIFNKDLDFYSSQIPAGIKILPSNNCIQNFFRPTLKALKWYTKNYHFVLAFWKFIYAILCKKSAIFALEVVWPRICTHIKKIETEYDVAIAYNDYSPWIFAKHCVKAEHYVGWNHNDYVYMGYHNLFYGKYLKYMDRIVTISEKCKTSLITKFDLDKKKICIVNNIVNGKELKEKAVKFSVQYPENSIVMLSIGRLSEQKGYEMFICALAEIKTEVKWKFYIIGEGPDKARLENLILKKQMEDRIILLGAKSNPYPYIKNCDIYVQPSKFEGYGIAIDEAALFYKPLVVTDSVGERFIDGEDAMLVSYELEAWKRAIKNILEDEGLRNHLSEGTCKRCEGEGKIQFLSMLSSLK